MQNTNNMALTLKQKIAIRKLPIDDKVKNNIFMKCKDYSAAQKVMTLREFWELTKQLKKK